MTSKLYKLVEEWNEEKEVFKRASERYLQSTNSLVKINEAIYNQAKEEGLTIDEACKIYEHTNKS